MPHRGRLNVLANFVGKPFAAVFSEFQGNSTNPEHVHGSGDVKYHLGTSSDREVGGRMIHLSLAANPSHLEAVDPVVLGKVRAKQLQRGDTERSQVVGILMHGDAAFAGQGLVAESLELSDLIGFCTGGTIHIIVNNQIGFTTAPSAARSSPYPSDVAKGVQAPIFHVNGDDPEAVVEVARVATEFRQHFKKDVVIDLFCYRRHGHNETDEPAFTQPLMYRTIARHPTTRQIYAKRLVETGVLREGEADAMAARFIAELETQFESAKSYRPNKADWLEGAWAGLEQAPDDDRRGDTGVAGERLRQIGLGLVTVPEGFRLNPKIARQLEAKRAAIEAGEGIDWATAEALAIGSLCAEGTHVRMSGQDSGRGTFSQRHAVLVDQETEERYVPIDHVSAGQAPFEIIDSPLSEAAVVGFEYGYSLADPHALVLWEAQFGDFANGAQVIIDQFLSSGEAKWLRMSGLVMLLPHGYEGQGPEHSSARHRALSAALRRRQHPGLQPDHRGQLLPRPAAPDAPQLPQAARHLHAEIAAARAKEVMSRLDEMGPGTSFHRVIDESEVIAADDDVRRVVLCTGKVYFDLAKARARNEDNRVALLRIEQLYPFPFDALAKVLQRYRNAEVRLVPGRAAEHGRLVFRRPANRAGPCGPRRGGQAAALCRPGRGGVARRPASISATTPNRRSSSPRRWRRKTGPWRPRSSSEPRRIGDRGDGRALAEAAGRSSRRRRSARRARNRQGDAGGSGARRRHARRDPRRRGRQRPGRRACSAGSATALAQRTLTHPAASAPGPTRSRIAGEGDERSEAGDGAAASSRSNAPGLRSASWSPRPGCDAAQLPADRARMAGSPRPTCSPREPRRPLHAPTRRPPRRAASARCACA